MIFNRFKSSMDADQTAAYRAVWYDAIVDYRGFQKITAGNKAGIYALNGSETLNTS